LRSIQFFPTFRCNDACTFCFNRGIAASGKVDAQQYLKLIASMSAFGIPEIDMLGGEPTLLPFLCDRIESTIAKNIRVNISSNGSQVPLLAELAHRFPPNQVRIGISISARPLPESLQTFIERFRPALKNVCTRELTIPETAERFITMPRIDYYLIFMDALRPGDLDHTIPYPAYRKRLAALQQKHANVRGVVCDGFVPDGPAAPALAGVRCPAGTTKLSVMPDGATYPCYLLFRHPAFRLGNIFSDPVEAILDNPLLDFFRSFEGNPCTDSSCEYHQECHGGCPAVSLMLTGDLSAPDPRCRGR
jgi:radical SAM protein with 4Fe4S-binding SPASM domain